MDMAVRTNTVITICSMAILISFIIFSLGKIKHFINLYLLIFTVKCIVLFDKYYYTFIGCKRCPGIIKPLLLTAVLLKLDLFCIKGYSLIYVQI